MYYFYYIVYRIISPVPMGRMSRRTDFFHKIQKQAVPNDTACQRAGASRFENSIFNQNYQDNSAKYLPASRYAHRLQMNDVLELKMEESPCYPG